MKIGRIAIIVAGMLLLTGCSFELQRKSKAKYAPVQEEELLTTHTVVKGETLWDIAKDVYGDPYKWKLIYEANRDILEGPDSLKPGQVLNIPQE